MDRFIEAAKTTVNAAAKNLKSNMDRFIVNHLKYQWTYYHNLKSNMDRFIADKKSGKAIYVKNLKSNMDRFIGL